MNVINIEYAEQVCKIRERLLRSETQKLSKFVARIEEDKKNLELLKTQIASARIDGKKEFDADTYMKGKKK